jgi:DNA-binding Lrp family transcriptional regulator
MESAEAMQKLLERFKECPRVINVFKTIGGYNLITLVVAEDQEVIGHTRSEFYTIGKIYFTPFLLVREYLTHIEKEEAPCNVDCKPCRRYLNNKCVGCPATKHYKGTLLSFCS